MGLLHVKGETDTLLCIQQSRNSWDKGVVFRESAKAEASESILCYLGPRSLMGASGFGSRFLFIKESWSDP